MPQLTINIEPHDKEKIVNLTFSLSKELKMNKISQADVIHYLLEHYEQHKG